MGSIGVKSVFIFGNAGTYTLYRSGSIDFADDNYPVFFARDELYAREYAYDKNGNRRDTEKYSVILKKPLVIELKATDASTMYNNMPEGKYFMHNEQVGSITAYNQLFGTRYDVNNLKDVNNFLNNATTKLGRSKAQLDKDKKILEEALKKGYDSVVYKFDKPENFKSGSPLKNPRSREEIIIPSSKARSLKKKNGGN